MFMEKYSDLMKSVDNIFILYGTTVNNYKEQTKQYVSECIEHAQTYNNNVYILNSPTTDQDFKYIVTLSLIHI